MGLWWFIGFYGFQSFTGVYGVEQWGQISSKVAIRFLSVPQYTFAKLEYFPSPTA